MSQLGFFFKTPLSIHEYLGHPSPSPPIRLAAGPLGRPTVGTPTQGHLLFSIWSPCRRNANPPLPQIWATHPPLHLAALPQVRLTDPPSARRRKATSFYTIGRLVTDPLGRPTIGTPGHISTCWSPRHSDKGPPPLSHERHKAAFAWPSHRLDAGALLRLVTPPLGLWEAAHQSSA
ncbi:hypothetical protein GUJ93_ZPchr0013g36044 [Zizania palustris]|uniref:Uncharacterized protein n=1 Tax=Zizania palustris TaxID=103762 RepID=A0A8J6BZQ4_ZIZPA|nr:hypothetical protein GUJ93_ZPchr0013g36044 [Zizania palustris]